jgi:hypothetical protein
LTSFEILVYHLYPPPVNKGGETTLDLEPQYGILTEELLLKNKNMGAGSFLPAPGFASA